jgi:hypothetical protein
VNPKYEPVLTLNEGLLDPLVKVKFGTSCRPSACCDHGAPAVVLTARACFAAVDGREASYPAAHVSSNDLCHAIYLDAVDLIMKDDMQ